MKKNKISHTCCKSQSRACNPCLRTTAACSHRQELGQYEWRWREQATAWFKSPEAGALRRMAQSGHLQCPGHCERWARVTWWNGVISLPQPCPCACHRFCCYPQSLVKCFKQANIGSAVASELSVANIHVMCLHDRTLHRFHFPNEWPLAFQLCQEDITQLPREQAHVQKAVPESEHKYWDKSELYINTEIKTLLVWTGTKKTTVVENEIH